MDTINGNTKLHLACVKNDINIIKNIKNPEELYKTNNDGDTCMHILAKYGNYDTLLELIKKYNIKQSSLLDILNSNDISIIDFIEDPIYLKKVLKKDEKISDNLLVKLINNNKLKLLDINNYDMNKALLYATKINDIDLIKYLINNKADINTKIQDTTALMHAVNNNNGDITKLLVENKADTSYGGENDDFLPINIAIINNNIPILNLLYDENKSQYKIKDKYLNIPLHYLLESNKTKKWTPKKIFEIILKNSDLNTMNIKKTTPLHMLTMYNEWQNYKEILKEKEFNLNIKDRHNKKPIDYVNKHDYMDFLKMARHKTPIVKEIKIKEPKIKKTNFGIFNSDIIHNFIYTSIFLDRYPDLMIEIPKSTNNYNNNTIFKKNKNSIIISNILNMYSNFPKFIAHILIWQDKNNNYISDEIIPLKLTRFTYYKLTINDNGMMHANSILYDKEKNVIIKFEPYGNIENNVLNTFLKEKFNKLYPNVELIVPNIPFQAISDDSNIENRKLGDPNGYCLAWSFWFIELCMNNPDTDVILLINNAYKNILNKDYSDYNQFIEYIRDYASRLNSEKNKLLLKAGIKKDDLYSLNYTENRIKKIADYINNNLEKKIKELN